MHSLISPSTAHIWGPVNGCKAYPFVATQYPQEETEDDRRGSAAHWLGTVLIMAHRDNISLNEFPIPAKMIDAPAPNGIIIDRDIYDSAQVYASAVVTVCKSHNWEGELLIEQMVRCPSIHSESYGTPDIVFITPHIIYIWDFKNGHVSISPYENWQCINYISGVLDTKGIDGLGDQRIKVVVTIVQPNAYDGQGPVKKWECFASDLRGYFNTLHDSANAVFEQGGSTTTSGPHCRFCEARFGCVSALNAGFSFYESAMRMTVADDPASVSTHYLLVKEAYDRLNSLRKGLDAQINSMLRSGQQVPGVHLGKTLSRSREWDEEKETVLQIGDSYDVNLRKERLMSPPEAEVSGMSKDIVNSISSRRETGFKVVIDDQNEIRRIFT